MVPTARAVELREPLREVLVDVRGLLHPNQQFDPSNSSRGFRILTNGFAGYAFLPGLKKELSDYGASIDLFVQVLIDENLRDRLGQGDADLALVTGEIGKMPETLMHRKLYDDPFVCIIRKDHEALDGDELSLKSYANLEHILVSPRGENRGVVDVELEERGLSRRVSIVVPNFMAVPGLLCNSDCVVTIPRSIAHMYRSHPDLLEFTPPMDLPVGTLFALWHQRMQEDVGHKWFRQVMASASAHMERFIQSA
jgi:DNA-binding transcriptional LysR family regulator